MATRERLSQVHRPDSPQTSPERWPARWCSRVGGIGFVTGCVRFMGDKALPPACEELRDDEQKITTVLGDLSVIQLVIPADWQRRQRHSHLLLLWGQPQVPR